MQRRLAKVPYVQEIESPYAAGNGGQISQDGRSVLIRFKVAGDDTQTQDRVGAALDAVSAAQAANPDFTIAESGDASINKKLNDSISADFKQALLTSLPITLIILLIAFGALVAAGVPLLLALTAVIGTIGLMGPLSHLTAVDQSVNEVILLIGLRSVWTTRCSTCAASARSANRAAAKQRRLPPRRRPRAARSWSPASR